MCFNVTVCGGHAQATPHSASRLKAEELHGGTRVDNQSLESSRSSIDWTGQEKMLKTLIDKPINKAVPEIE